MKGKEHIMQTKRRLISLFAVLGLLFFMGNSQAAKPEGVGGQKDPEVRESFFQRWFGGAKKDEVKTTKEDKKTHKEKKVKEEKSKVAKHDKKERRTFSDTERASIHDYYRHENSQHSGDKHKNKNNKGKKKQLPPGLQKKLERGGELPPGWQTKVNRGEVLDADILRYAEPLPTELSRRLPILRDGEEMLRIGDRVVRVVEGNGTVLDVVDLADVMLR
jgi:hypothetical protein